MNADDPNFATIQAAVYDLTDQIKATIQFLKDAGVATTEDVAKTRLNVCLTCEFFISRTNEEFQATGIPALCSKTNAGMKILTRNATVACPEGKWSAVTPSNDI